MIIDELIAILGYDVKGQGELDRFNRGLDRTQRHAQAVANRINAMSVAFGAFIGTVASQAFMRLGSVIGSLPGDVLKVGQEFENLQTVLTTIEGSSTKAKEAMDWVQDFAATTPYDLNQVSEAFVRMRAYGLDPMSGLLKRVGDASAGMGKSLMQGVEAIADAVTGENERLKEFGIKAKVQGDQITYNWNENGKEMSKTVRKNGPEIIAALTEIFGRFDGAMDKLSKTQGGILSNLGDSWTGFLKKIAESGYYDYVTRKLRGVQDSVERWTKDGTMDRWAKSISGAFIGAMGSVERYAWGIWKLGDLVSQAFKNLTGGKLDMTSLQALEGIIALLMRRFMPLTFWITAAYFAIDDFLAYLKGDKSVIGEFVKYIEQLTGASEGLAQAIAAVVGGLGLLFLMKPGLLLGGIGKKLPVGGAAGAAAGTAGGIGGAAGFLGVLGRIGLGAGIVAGIAGLISSYGPEVAKKARKPKEGEPASWLGFDPTESREDRLKRLRAPKAPEQQSSSGGLVEGNIFIRMLAAMERQGVNATAATVPTNDNRDQSTHVSVGGVNVNVQSPAAAPAATGAAVGQAVGRAAVPMAGRLAIDSAF